MIYNAFGLSVTDVVNSFQDVVVTDFDTNGISGSQVITKEIEFAEAELISHLSEKVIGLFDHIDYMVVPPISASYRLPFEFQDNLYIYQVPRYNPALNNSYSALAIDCECTNAGCANTKTQLSASYLFNDYTRNGNVITFGSSFNQDINTYYITYDIASSLLSLPSLAAMLRNMVCCSLGRKIYSTSAEDSKYIISFCDKAQMALEAIDEHFIPSEYKKLKYLNPIVSVSGGITTMKIGRS